MTKDKALEDLFLAAKPTFDDNEQFMTTLTRRLDAVEFLKQHEEATLRRYKLCMIATFVLGIVLGGGATALILSQPVDVPLIKFEVESGVLLLIEQYSRTLSIVILSGLIGFDIISIINQVNDIVSMKRDMKLSLS